jgi:RNA polymerase sigma-70 factor (ECF subfamily)
VLGEDFAADLAAARAGDEAAFARIWRRTQPALLRFLRVRDPALADDVAAEAWVTAIDRLSDFEGDEAGFRAWMTTIARRRLIDHHRRTTRRPERLTDSDVELEHSAPASADTADVADERASTERALRLIAQLPPDVAEMVALRVIVGLDVAQVAEIVGRKPGAVRVAVHRGLRKLAATLEGATTAPGVRSSDVTPVRPTTFKDRDA